MKIEIVIFSPLKGIKDIFIADNDNGVFTFNDKKVEGDINLFIHEVYDIIYDWKENYENPNILDGFSYNIRVSKNNKLIKEIIGQNNTPENFNELLRLLSEVKENGYS